MTFHFRLRHLVIELAIEEARQITSGKIPSKSYTSLSDLLADLNED